MTRDVRAVAALHATFFAAAGVVTLALDAPAKGWAVLALVVAYNVGLPLTARAVGRRDWVLLWRFLLPVSIFQIVPDWILATVVGTLDFPVIGGPRLDDAINLSMGGMWVPPLFIVLALARGSAPAAAGLAVAVFLGSELLAPVVDLWEPTGDTTQVAGVALYVLPAEAALGWAAATAFALVGAASHGRRVLAALATSTFYTGALVVAYFAIDVAGWSVTV
ncbi:hypothetical protein DSM112329_00997 [Paraconexibacter sp. AEG42_29]|uniref:DUF6989 domain-containing protein n=1 Tax=Paraconexibacter sp. AEG42_29 TaxID=2997339 RepID=A0AAU7AR88_9ACTN